MKHGYQVAILRRAQKSLAAIPSPDFERLRDAIVDLGRDPRPLTCKKLTGRSGWRLRVGDFRVVYEIDDPAHAVTVLDIGHRRDIYR